VVSVGFRRVPSGSVAFRRIVVGGGEEREYGEWRMEDSKNETTNIKLEQYNLENGVGYFA
jgi:hypothetical protein